MLAQEHPLRTLQQISAVSDLCCIVTKRSVESVGGVFDPVVKSALAVFEQKGCVDWLRTAQCTPSRHQVARDETVESLISLPFPKYSLSGQPVVIAMPQV